MTTFEIENALESMILFVDTREKPTEKLNKRIEDIGLPSERKKLNVGDYSCSCTLPDGSILDFSDKIAIERKMSIDELCGNFGKTRVRFTKEFERARSSGMRIYLLIEGCSLEKIVGGKYKSLLSPNALLASIFAWIPRYNIVPIFCKSETTSRVIKEILYREVKEILESIGERCDKGRVETNV